VNDRLPLKFRLLAAALHVIECIPMGILAIYSLSLLILSNTISSFENVLVIDFLFGLPLIALLPFIAWIQWLLTKRSHPFVDRAGRSIINYALNMLLLTLFLLFAFITTCGVVTSGNSGGSIADNFLFASLVTLNCLAIAYALNAGIAGIFALNGLQFKNRLIYPFVRDIE
jgi:uncharacterized Tic20 family protein